METNKTNLIPEEELKNVSGGASGGVDATRSATLTWANNRCDRYVCSGCSYISLGKQHSAHCRVPQEERNICCGCRYFEPIPGDETDGYCKVDAFGSEG